MVGAETNQLCKYIYVNNVQLMKWQECFAEVSYSFSEGNTVF